MIKSFTLPKYRTAIFWVLALLVLYIISRCNYNLFHSFADGVSIVIAACVFTIIWNGRRIIDNDYFLYVGIAFLFFAFMDLMHLLGNKNMGVFPEYGNLGPALYIASRYILSISFTVAPLFINRKLNTTLMFAVYSLVTLLILLSIFYWHIFPVCIVEGVGLTPFKVVSDYIICLILLGAIGLLLINRRSFDSRVLWLIVSSIIVSIVTGLAFTLYADPFGIMNMVGHLLQIASFYLVFLAFIETSLTKPQEILYRKVKQNEEDLTKSVQQLDYANVELKQEIAERKLATVKKEELERRFQQAQKAESLGRMAGAIAHHYNNLLGVVLGSLDLALDEVPHGSGPWENIAEAMKASRRAAEISRLMLAYLGQGIGKREPMDLAEICREALSPLSSPLPKKIRLKTEFPAQGAIIRADAVQMKLILTNLVVNAGEAIGDGEGDITVTIGVYPAADIHAPQFYPSGWKPKAETYACLSIADTGFGITPETMEKLFDPFFSTKFTGRGLSLPVVMGIVKAHEGAVTVDSKPGYGATFRVFLPVTAEKPLQPRKAEQVEARASEGRDLVLVVDDEPTLRNMAQKMIKLIGYEVIMAEDGAEAVEAFRQHQDQICCVLCDLTMPGMDGWETLEALRRIQPDLRVILSSGYNEAQVMAGEHPERPQVFLNKPYALADLKSAFAGLRKER